MAALVTGFAEGTVRLSKTSPRFLHANSTSHTWIFSAIAELIDNAYDPDVSASELHIDKTEIFTIPCLTLTDNGQGMDPDKLHKMLSFGYCEKVEIKGHKPVGHYGNGFKSGSMRLGNDAIVFTRHTQTMSVGFLSQTYLKAIKSDEIRTPIVTWDRNLGRRVITPDSKASLDAITMFSQLFPTEKSLWDVFAEMGQETKKTGTKIFIYNLKKGTDGKLELDFDSKPGDIINPESQAVDLSVGLNYRPVSDYTPEYKRSLREYCSILFLKPRMKIKIRGKKVKSKLISKSLSNTEMDPYRPTWHNKFIKIIFGFSSTKEDYGIMLYHRNRLIKAYERVGCQKQGNEAGVGIVGVVEANFLVPIHNKQDFNKTDKYNSLMNALGMKLNDYWNEKVNGTTGLEAVSQLPDWTWAQCEQCLKWRRLPLGITEDKLPEKWYCYMNPDPTHNRCDVAEEPEDEDAYNSTCTYEKTFKKKQTDRKKKDKEQERILQIEKEQQLAIRSQQVTELQYRLRNTQSQLVATQAQVISTTGGVQVLDMDRKPTDEEIQDSRRKLEGSRREVERLKIDLNLNLNRSKNQLKRIGQQTPAVIEHSMEVIGEGRSTVSSTSNKRGSSMEYQAFNKVRVVDRDGDAEPVVTERPTSEPKVIVILSDDDEEDNAGPSGNTVKREPAEVKPSINDVTGTSGHCVRCDTRANVVESGVQTDNCAVAPKTEEQALEALRRNSKDQEERIQKLVGANEDAAQRINSIRANVKKLFNWVVPDIEVPSLDAVDELLTAVVKENAVDTPDNEPSSSSQQ